MPKSPYFEHIPSFEGETARALAMARPRRGTAETLDLTPEEKERVDSLLKQAKQAETAAKQEPDEQKRIALYGQALDWYTQIKTDLLAIKEKKEKKKRGEKVPEAMREIIESSCSSLEQALNSRFEELDSDLRFEISSPEIPGNLTPEHLEVLKELFGGNLETAILPKPEELHDLDEEYAKVMYPPKDQARQERDVRNHAGLVSFRPDWFDQASDADLTKSDETWGQAYLRSMKAELQIFGGALALIETTQKPNYTDGSQRYGSQEGADPNQDPLLPLFQEVFGENANRFNHSWDELQDQLLPKLKEAITKAFEDKGLAVPDFEVILAPASLQNLQTTLFHPENSQTNTWEWTSTILIDKEGDDAGHRLGVGHSGNGGAADVGGARRGDRWVDGGARPAVVFLRKHTDT